MNGEEAWRSSSSYGVPFFTRPFGTMFGCTGGLFGPAGFAAMRSLLLLRAFESKGVYVEELLDDFEETLQSKASNYQQHTVEHPGDVVSLMHQSGDQLSHEALSDGGSQFHETDKSFENLSFQNSGTAGHGGLENLCYSLSSPQLGQVHEVIKKRNITCTESNFNTGYLEPPRKLLKSRLFDLN